VGRKEESYEARQKREEASRILESTEMLIWWSAARNEVRFFVFFPISRIPPITTYNYPICRFFWKAG
jgi:hypothetical protein